jgi:hypothetical protein
MGVCVIAAPFAQRREISPPSRLEPVTLVAGGVHQEAIRERVC